MKCQLKTLVFTYLGRSIQFLQQGYRTDSCADDSLHFIIAKLLFDAYLVE